MFVRRFLVSFEKMPIDRTSVKSGRNGLEVVTACRCVNIGLFVSGNLRRDVVVSLAVGLPDDLRIVSFPGQSLRRVSPDERSISFFLLKAIEKLENLEVGNSFTMDNGIELTRTSLDEMTETWGNDMVRVPSSSPERFILDTNLSADRLEKAS